MQGGSKTKSSNYEALRAKTIKLFVENRSKSSQPWVRQWFLGYEKHKNQRKNR